MSKYPVRPAVLLIFLLKLLTLQAFAQPKVSLPDEGMPDFREVYTGYFSDVQFYVLVAEDAESNLVLKAEGPFRISLGCYEGFTDSLLIDAEKGKIEETIYVRFFPESTGHFEGEIKHISGNNVVASLALSGRGIETSIPDGYYDAATGNGSELKTRLHSIIRGHNVQSYSSLWEHFYVTDATFGGYVWDIYSDIPCGDPPYIYVFGDDQDTGTGGHHNEGEVYNREHSMPRSWFGGAVNPMNTDLFHIFPVDKFVNAQRDNFPFGEVDDPFWTSLNGGRLGPNTAGDYSGTAFEPVDEYKGDLARAFFYMITRYQDLIIDWTYNEYGNAMLDHNPYPGYRSWVIDMLAGWHRDDPVSQKERLRNQAVYEIQGNRNPFVDHPEMVERIWGDTTLYTSSLQDATGRMHIYPNPASDDLVVDLGGEEIIVLEVYNAAGVLIKRREPASPSFTLNLKGFPQGRYLLVATSKWSVYRENIIKL